MLFCIGRKPVQLACRPGGDLGILMDRGGARNRAILWVLLDTGMSACELCGLNMLETRPLNAQKGIFNEDTELIAH